MNKLIIGLTAAALSASASYAVEEADPALAEIINFRQYSDSFSSAGQPTREQFQVLADQGFERIGDRSCIDVVERDHPRDVLIAVRTFGHRAPFRCWILWRRAGERS